MAFESPSQPGGNLEKRFPDREEGPDPGPQLSSSVRKWAQSLGARCTMCPLRDEIAVGPARVENPKLVLVGEGPGRIEERFGQPFLGLSGKLLDRLLAKNKIDRRTVHITNSALCRTDKDKLKREATKCCAPRLLTELSRIPKKVPVVAAGKEAARSILGQTAIILARGFIWTAPEIDVQEPKKAILKLVAGSPRRVAAELRKDTLVGRSKLAGRTIFPILHPAHILRAETWHPLIQIDFGRVGRWLRGEITSFDDVGTELVTRDVRRLRQLGPVVSLDVETTETQSVLTAKLLCVGLSDGRQEIVLWPWKKKMAKPLARFLKTREAVVGHNAYIFDRVVLERHEVY